MIQYDFKKYFHWSANALLGLNPVATDAYLMENLEVIKVTANKLLKKCGYISKEIYRGVIMPELLQGKLPPHKNFSYLSFSEDKDIAYSFANPEKDGFGSVFYLGSNGYIISYLPSIDEVLFHHDFLNIFPYKKSFEKVGLTGMENTMEVQKEVIILQPENPFNVTDYKHFKQQLI